MSHFSDLVTRLVLDRLSAVLGPCKKWPGRGKFYFSGGNCFTIRSADPKKVCGYGNRLHWSSAPDLELFGDRMQAARDSNRLLDFVFATAFNDLWIWIIPAHICHSLTAFREIYIKELPDGRQVMGVEGNQRPLGDLDLRRFLIIEDLSEEERSELEASRGAA